MTSKYASQLNPAGFNKAELALKTLTPGAHLSLTVEAAAKDGNAGGGVQSVPRYSLTVVDRKTRGKSGPLAAFVVPIGKEHEWNFASEEGQDGLAMQAGYSRLAIVTMHRGQVYEVQSDVDVSRVSSMLMNLCQPWNADIVGCCDQC